MSIDSQKRTTMKLLAVTTGAMAAPGVIAAANLSDTQQSSATELDRTGLVVSFSETTNADGTRQVIVTNTSDKAVTLSQVYPGIVSTPQGAYDLNSLVHDGSREFAPKQANTLTIEPVKTAEAKYPTMSGTASNSWISVRTRDSRINGGKHVTTVRHMFA